jgi:hypothetical protein
MTIIKNFGMPHNCYDCDLHNYHECDLTGESIEEDYCWNGDSREKHCPLREVEAIPKADYENRLKADMVAMLTEIQLEIEELETSGDVLELAIKDDCKDIIQQKINSLEEA